MVRTLGFLLLVCASLFWMPWWFTVGLLAVSVAICPIAIAFLIPALGGDYIQSPHIGTLFQNHLLFLICIGLICIKYLIYTRTRFHHVYDQSSY